VQDIRDLKSEQEDEISALQSELDDKKALVASLREKLDEKKAAAARKNARTFGGEECVIQ
jgi:hypothetical protein